MSLNRAVTVRYAKSDDFPWVLSELKRFAEEAGEEHLFPSDSEFAMGFLSGLAGKHVFLVAEGDERMGFIAGALTPHYFNPNVTSLAEVFWWVSPEHRNSRAGLLLLTEYIRQGKARADIVCLTLKANSPVRETTLKRRGFQLSERNFVLGG